MICKKITLILLIFRVGGFEYLQQFAIPHQKNYKKDFVSEFKGIRTHYLLQTGNNKDYENSDENDIEIDKELEGAKTDGHIYQENAEKRGILKKDRAASESRLNSNRSSQKEVRVEEEEDKAVDDELDQFKKSVEKGEDIDINEEDIKLDDDYEEEEEVIKKEEEDDKKEEVKKADEGDDFGFDDEEFNYENSQKSQKMESNQSQKMNYSDLKDQSKSKSGQSNDEPTTKELVIVEGFTSIDESQVQYNEEEVRTQCENYFKKLDKMFTESFKSDWDEISSLLHTYDKEIFITFREKGTGKLKGLAILSINQSKAEILHISTLNKKDFTNACSMVCTYAKNNSVIKDVIIGVDHREVEVDGKAKVKMDPFFKEKLKEIGFKWLKIENVDGRRFTVFKLKSGIESNEASGGNIMRLSTGKIQVSKVFVDHFLVLSDTTPEYSNIISGILNKFLN